MDEIVETLDQVFQLRPNGADQRHESVASSDDNAEIDNLNGPEDDFEATSVEATFANEQSLVFVEESSQSSSSGLGSDSRKRNAQPHAPGNHISPDHITWRAGLPTNRPMVHSIACSASGDFVAAGLESSTIELFAGNGKRLNHSESLYGHNGGVSALHFINDSYLVSGGNDRNIFIWTLGSEVTVHNLFHGEKVNAFEGTRLNRIIVADFSPVIQNSREYLCLDSVTSYY
ncbi:unnamed protein product [Heterobilharzia americana]|nr:unnamed protein product [Heterobilharzia americana]